MKMHLKNDFHVFCLVEKNALRFTEKKIVKGVRLSFKHGQLEV